jgi:hypothetical protein
MFRPGLIFVRLLMLAPFDPDMNGSHRIPGTLIAYYRCYISVALDLQVPEIESGRNYSFFH